MAKGLRQNVGVFMGKRESEGRVNDLKKRLREFATHYSTLPGSRKILNEAALRIEALEEELGVAREGWYLANGVAELAMKHRDMAEVALSKATGGIDQSPDFAKSAGQ